MVAPLIAAVGALGVIGFGAIGFLVADFVLYWGSIATGFAIAGLSLRYLIEEDPVPILSDDQANNILYLIFSIAVGLISFKAVQAVALALGFTAALVAAVLLVAGWFLGFGVVASALSSLAFFAVDLWNEAN